MKICGVLLIPFIAMQLFASVTDKAKSNNSSRTHCFKLLKEPFLMKQKIPTMKKIIVTNLAHCYFCVQSFYVFSRSCAILNLKKTLVIKVLFCYR